MSDREHTGYSRKEPTDYDNDQPSSPDLDHRLSPAQEYLERIRNERATNEGKAQDHSLSDDVGDGPGSGTLSLRFTQADHLKDLSDHPAVTEKLRELHADFKAHYDGPGNQDATFRAAAVYGLTNTRLSDPTGAGPLNYLQGDVVHALHTGDPDTNHKATSCQRLLKANLDSSSVSWNPTNDDPGSGAALLEPLQTQLHAGEQHMDDFAAHSRRFSGESSPRSLTWTNTRDHNLEAIAELTRDYTDMDRLDRVADNLSNRASEQADLSHELAQSRPDDEPDTRHSTAVVAHAEMLSEKSALRDIASALRTDPDNPELRDKAADTFSYMHYAADLQAFTNWEQQQIRHGNEQHQLSQDPVEPEVNADPKPLSIRGRLGRLFQRG